MITAFYAALLTLLIVKLSLSVITLRRQHKIRLGDGGNSSLLKAIRAQSNAIEYIPIALILMLLLELNGAPKLLLHLLGLTLLAGRIIHAGALPSGNMSKRTLGMKITIFLLITLALLNLFYLPYNQLI